MNQTIFKSNHSPFVLLAPANVTVPCTFLNRSLDMAIYTQMLAKMQVMRGAVALQEGAIHPKDLDGESRYQMPGDAASWHLLRVSKDGSIRGCARVLVHPERVAFAALRLSQSAIAKSVAWSTKVRLAVETDVNLARAAKLTLIEPGGWVVDTKWRGGMDGVSIALSLFAWSQLIGGCLAYVTATAKHGSSSILKRLGGSSLSFAGTPIPRYFDPQYGCEMEIIKLNTKTLNARFEPLMDSLRNVLASSMIVQCCTASLPLPSQALIPTSPTICF